MTSYALSTIVWQLATGQQWRRVKRQSGRFLSEACLNRSAVPNLGPGSSCILLLQEAVQLYMLVSFILDRFVQTPVKVLPVIAGQVKISFIVGCLS